MLEKEKIKNSEELKKVAENSQEEFEKLKNELRKSEKERKKIEEKYKGLIDKINNDLLNEKLKSNISLDDLSLVIRI